MGGGVVGGRCPCFAHMMLSVSYLPGMCFTHKYRIPNRKEDQKL